MDFGRTNSFISLEAKDKGAASEEEGGAVLQVEGESPIMGQSGVRRCSTRTSGNWGSLPTQGSWLAPGVGWNSPDLCILQLGHWRALRVKPGLSQGPLFLCFETEVPALKSVVPPCYFLPIHYFIDFYHVLIYSPLS